MAHVIPCPIPGYDGKDDQGQPMYSISLPDVWKGYHAKRRDDALNKASAAKMTGTQLTFCVAMALLEDWRLPGIFGGNVDAWNFDELPLSFVGWVNEVVLPDFNACFDVKKKHASWRKSG